jgi:hypothetical protein
MPNNGESIGNGDDVMTKEGKEKREKRKEASKSLVGTVTHKMIRVTGTITHKMILETGTRGR